MKESNDSESRNQGGRDLLIKANLKFIDAMSCVLAAKMTNFSVSFHVGRSYCLAGDYATALMYLKDTLNWTDTYWQVLARFYYAYALSKQASPLTQDTAEVVVSYLAHGVEVFIAKLGNDGYMDRRKLFSEDHLSLFKSEFIEAFLIIARIKSEFSIQLGTISVENACR